jgi:serine/threonine protein kinase
VGATLDLAGQILVGKYELTRMLGKGGMGEVWEGEHAITGRRVAVKILAERYLSNKKVVARFGREARAASAVQHEGIVEILDQDRTDTGMPFLVMEFLEGESVGQRIKRLGKLSQDETLAIMLPLLDALDAAHQAGIIHRDLKPDNVFILPGARGEERIKILDFGISQKSDEIEHHLTQEGSVLGTPHYMSPEQARGEANIDGRVDVYAVGVMFFECVVGDVPFDANNYNALLQIILGSPPPSARSRGAEITPAIEQLVLAAMDKKRDRRPPNARAFHSLLLEAGMQEDDAMLDASTWTFSSPSGPPPPIDFGPDEFPNSDLPPTAKAVRDPEDMFPHLPAGFELDDVPPPRHTPLAGDRAPGRGAQGFSVPAEAARRAPGPPVPVRGQQAPLAPRPVPAPPPRMNDLPAFALDAPAAQRRAPEPAAAPFGEFGMGTPSRLGGMGQAQGGMTPERARRAAERPPLSGETDEKRGTPVLRSVLGWLFALAALAALAYLANTVFKRPDPRKQRRANEAASEAASEAPR